MKLKRFLSLAASAAAITVCMYSGPALAANHIMRVALTVQGTDTFTEPKLENVSGEPDGYTIGTMDGTTFNGSTPIDETQLTIKLVNDSFQVSNTVDGTILYTSPPGAEHIAIHPNSSLTWFKGFQWPGDFVYKRVSSNSITVINYVELEDYVKGVLPYEIDPNWPDEALKAQAVCARSFALCTTKHKTEGYDLCNTTNCQVYFGANKATPASNSAVDQTQGEYIFYNGNAVEGNFFSSDGGATEDAANVWGNEVGYLKGKIDPYEENSEKWSVTLTADEIQKKLTDAGYTIGRVSNVEVTKRTPTDNVAEVTVTDTNNHTVKIVRSSVRTVFGLKSIRYTITPGSATAAIPHSLSSKISPSVHKVKVDGQLVKPNGYNINGSNYFKLRDIAYIMNGTSSQFDVSWNKTENCIGLLPNVPYNPVGGEMSEGYENVKSCVPSEFPVELNGERITLSGYNINGYTYYKIRDIGEALGFEVGFSNPYVLIESSGASGATDSPESQMTSDTFTFSGTGWGHSVGMSQWGAYAMAEEGFTYEDILKFYFTGVEIAR